MAEPNRLPDASDGDHRLEGQHLTSETLRAAIYLLKLTGKDLKFSGHRRVAGTRRLGHGDQGFRELNSPHGKDGIT
jgi:hypothetical protein